MKTKSDFLEYLSDDCIGIQLGIGDGVETEDILLKNKLKYLYSVDPYENNRYDYKQALVKLDRFKDKHSIFKLNCFDVLDMFPRNFFNILFLNTSRTDVLQSFLGKMKQDGILIGDYIGEEKQFIDNFCREYRLVLHVIGEIWFIKLDETNSFSKMMNMLEL